MFVFLLFEEQLDIVSSRVRSDVTVVMLLPKSLFLS